MDRNSFYLSCMGNRFVPIDTEGIRFSVLYGFIASELLLTYLCKISVETTFSIRIFDSTWTNHTIILARYNSNGKSSKRIITLSNVTS